MAEENKSEQTTENNVDEGANPDDTKAATKKPDADATSVEAADDKKANEPVAKGKKDAYKPAANIPAADL